jgi:hypothetical protein
VTGPAAAAGAGDLPPALAALSLDQVEALEVETGRSFGAMIDELASGKWSIATMRALVGLVDPDRPLETLGDLVAAAGELVPTGGKAPALDDVEGGA